MTEASQIIAALGGTMKVAEALDLTPSTVSSWKSAKGGIPRWWKREIDAFAKRCKIDLSTTPNKEEAAQ